MSPLPHIPGHELLNLVIYGQTKKGNIFFFFFELT